MKQIHTTATTIRKIKTKAKHLKTELNIQLAKALDLAAIEAGYESFHHANHCLENSNKTNSFKGIGSLSFDIDAYQTDWSMFDEKGADLPPAQKTAGKFNVGQREQSLYDVTDELDELTDEIGSLTGDMTEIPHHDLQTIIRACARLTEREPAFIDGYAHCAGALVSIERHEECISMAEPVFNAILSLIPKSFTGFIPYYYLENRPFHRLAGNLVLAYHGAGKNSKAKSVAEKMLLWWPNDNMGFRFLLTGEEA